MTADDIAAVRLRLIIAALEDYPFRAPQSGESPRAFIEATIAHIESHDWAAAEEIRIGREQAAWTPEETRAFLDSLKARAPASHEPPADGQFDIRDIEFCGQWPVSDASMHTILEELLTMQMDERCAHPQQEVPILAGVLLLTGTLLVMAVGRRDRIAVLRYLAQHGPVYGYVLVFDAFMHIFTGTDRQEERAEKYDCLLGHLGTRTLRVVKRRPYRYVDNRTRVIIDPPLEDINPREDRWRLEDPYAEIFVSVPLPSSARPA